MKSAFAAFSFFSRKNCKIARPRRNKLRRCEFPTFNVFGALPLRLMPVKIRPVARIFRVLQFRPLQTKGRKYRIFSVSMLKTGV